MKPVTSTILTLSTVPFFLAALGPVGCGGDDGDGAGGDGGYGAGTAVGGGGGTAAGGGTAGGGGTVDPPDDTRMTLVGDATWTVTFDAAAQAQGATDCAYTRHYDGVQNQSAPWLCPQCDVIFEADVQMTAGEQDCYVQVSDAPPFEKEWVGYGAGTWWRGVGGPNSDQGTATVTADSVTIANLVEDLDAEIIGAGTMAFNVAGQFAVATADGDPMHGWRAAPTYACGWPKSGAASYGGDYALTVGSTLPDGLFKDSCDETVRLHDFQGTYLVVEMSAINCPACQSMALAKGDFISTMAGHGIEVRTITLMAPALDDPIGETTTSMLNSWISDHSLTASSAVLADRAWGLALFLPHTVDTLSYPGWIVVDPDLVVLDHGNGFSNFDGIQATIQNDAP